MGVPAGRGLTDNRGAESSSAEGKLSGSAADFESLEGTAATSADLVRGANDFGAARSAFLPHPTVALQRTMRAHRHEMSARPLQLCESAIQKLETRPSAFGKREVRMFASSRSSEATGIFPTGQYTRSAQRQRTPALALRIQ
jgi:hypothetical protein